MYQIDIDILRMIDESNLPENWKPIIKGRIRDFAELQELYQKYGKAYGKANDEDVEIAKEEFDEACGNILGEE